MKALIRIWTPGSSLPQDHENADYKNYYLVTNTDSQ